MLVNDKTLFKIPINIDDETWNEKCYLLAKAF